MACLWVTRNVFDWDTVIADNVVGQHGRVRPSAMLVRFWAFRRFVFKRHAVEFHGAKGTARVRDARGTQRLPELGPDEAELLEHQPQQRQADPHDVVGVARHPRTKAPPSPSRVNAPATAEGSPVAT